MTKPGTVVLLICADSILTERYVAGLTAACESVQLPLATNIPQARHLLERISPEVIVLDESALDPQNVDAWKQIVVVVSGHAPVIVVAAEQHQMMFVSLIGTGSVVMVRREGDFSPAVSEAVVQRLRRISRSTATQLISVDGENFGELLRHEMNNPLTGILGNAQLLLEKRHRLPQPVVIQIETIADLALRLRETVRRLSEMWESSREQQYTV